MLKKKLRNQKGFTLIEIIAVLVILGILAAVSIPKYLGMQDDAELATAKGAVAELNGRASLAYAKLLMASGTANGNNSTGYIGWDGNLSGWTSAANTPGSDISTLKRVDGTATFGAVWTGGDSAGPGYWLPPTRSN